MLLLPQIMLWKKKKLLKKMYTHFKNSTSRFSVSWWWKLFLSRVAGAIGKDFWAINAVAVISQTRHLRKCKTNTMEIQATHLSRGLPQHMERNACLFPVAKCPSFISTYICNIWSTLAYRALDDAAFSCKITVNTKPGCCQKFLLT